jgi:hypothetical protein
MSAVQIPLTTAFYKEIALIAWKELDESQKDKIKEFLVLRFIEEGPDVLDSLTQSRAKSLIADGGFDSKILENVTDVIGSVSTSVVKEAVQERISERINDLICDWVAKENVINVAVNSAIHDMTANESLKDIALKAVEGWCKNNVSHNQALGNTIKQNVCRRIELAFRDVDLG